MIAIARAGFACAAVVAALAVSPRVPAFAEDLCAVKGGGWEDCTRRPCDPREGGAGCQTVAMLTTVRSQAGDGAIGARSAVHFDATYYLAQAAGFAPREALRIAAYDQAVDTGRFWLRGENGRLLVTPKRCQGASLPPACALSSRSIIGTNRNDFGGGGVFFHFMPPAAGQLLIDGLNPRIQADSEPFLTHLERWAEDGELLCRAGLTTRSPAGDHALGDACFRNADGEPGLLVGRIPFVTELGFLGSVDWTARTGEQALAPPAPEKAPLPASRLRQQFGAQAAPVRLGILLHAVQDRISHHRCLDVSEQRGPGTAGSGEMVLNPVPYALYQLLQRGALGGGSVREQLESVAARARPDFIFDFDRKQCDQPQHALRHTWETGYPQAELPAADRTTAAALSASLRLLQAFAPEPAGMDAAARQQLVSAVVGALETPDAQARVEALGRLATEQGWLPLPAHAGVDTATWQQRAGPP